MHEERLTRESHYYTGVENKSLAHSTLVDWLDGKHFWKQRLEPMDTDGWITPDGFIYPCLPIHHDECAQWITDELKISTDLPRKICFEQGYAQLSMQTVISPSVGLTEAQRAALLTNHFVLPVEEDNRESLVMVATELLNMLKSATGYSSLSSELQAMIEDFLTVLPDGRVGILRTATEFGLDRHLLADQVFDSICQILDLPPEEMANSYDSRRLARINLSTSDPVYLSEYKYTHSGRDVGRGTELDVILLDVQGAASHMPYALAQIFKLNKPA